MKNNKSSIGISPDPTCIREGVATPDYSLEYLLQNGDVDLSIHVSLLKKFMSAVRGRP